MSVTRDPFITSGPYTASNAESFRLESDSLIDASGQTKSAAITDQTAKAVANLSTTGALYQEAGGSASDVYVLEKIGVQAEVTTLVIGMIYSFIVVNPNSGGAATIDLAALGAKPIKTETGNDPQVGHMIAGDFTTLRYDGTNFIGMNFKRITQTKTLSADAGDGEMTDLTFTVSPGKLYKISGEIQFNDNDGTADLIRTNVMDDAVSFGEVILAANSISNNLRLSVFFIFYHRFANASLKFVNANIGVQNEVVQGNGTTLETHVNVEEIDDILLEGTIQ